MKVFPLTFKRFNSLPDQRKHKWIALWLRDNYIDLLEKRFNGASLELFLKNYKTIRSWLNNPIVHIEIPTSSQKWLEFISDRFHDHQKQSGKGLSESNFLPYVKKLDKPIDEKWQASTHYKVALDNIRSAFNVGSIIRVIDAVGFESLMLSAKTPNKDNNQVKKTSMGSSEWIPQTIHENLVDELKNEKNDYSIIGLETVPDSTTYFEYPWPSKGIIVLGNEEYGISEELMKVCDDFVHIPMAGYKNSINVANAFSVIAFHIFSLKSKQLIN